MGWMQMQTYVTCSFILFLKFLVATSVQGLKTFDAGGRPPEDKSLSLAQGRPEQTYGLLADEGDAQLAKAREVELRWKRIVQNDLESIPLALLLFLGGVWAGGNKELFAVCMAVYTISRCLHTLAYAYSLQPHRAVCYGVGVLAIIVNCINSMAGVFK